MIWKYLFAKGKNGAGTLRSIAAELNTANLPLNAKKDLNRVEDFLETVTEAHIVCAMMKVLGGEINLENETEEGRKRWLEDKLEKFVTTYLDLDFKEHNPPSAPTRRPRGNKDLVFDHAKLVLNLGLFLLIVKKTTRRADGAMTRPLWKSLTGYFHLDNRKKYRSEFIHSHRFERREGKN